MADDDKRPLHVTHTADGRVFYSRPSDDGQKVLSFKAHGPLAELLREFGYVVNVAVERLDGGAFSAHCRAVVTAAVSAEAIGHDPREAAATVHFALAREGLDAEKAPSAKRNAAKTATKPRKAAAKRPSR